MSWSGGRRRILWISLGATVALVLFLVAVCGGGDDASEDPGPGGQAASAPASGQPTTVAEPASESSQIPATPSPTSGQAVVLTPASTPTATSPPASSPTSVPTAEPSLALRLLSPQDGAGVEIGVVGVLGKARPDAVVAVNGIPVDVGIDGAFRYDVILDDGANLVEVVASSLDGGFESVEAAVFLVSPAAGLPFSLLYPPDGLEVFEPKVEVLGATRPDAIVGINGIPLATNPLGIFFTTVPLEEGPNLIEVIATDISSNVRFQTIVIFYSP